MSEQPSEESGGLVSAAVQNSVLVLTVSPKEVSDPEVSYALRDEMTSRIDASGCRNVVIDLLAVDFIGSVGLLALLGVRRRLNESDGRVVLCNISELIRQMLAACRLISTDGSQPAVFETATTLDEALSRLAAAGQGAADGP